MPEEMSVIHRQHTEMYTSPFWRLKQNFYENVSRIGDRIGRNSEP